MNDFVSIIVPVRNEEKYIGDCLESVVSQDFPKEQYEILVVDGVSEDKTRKIAEEFRKNNNNLEVLENPQKIASTGLNIGIKKAKGNIIARIDGRARASSDYLKQALFYLKKTGADCVGGMQTATGQTKIEKAVARALNSPLVGSEFHYSQKEKYTKTVYLGVYRKEVFEKIGLFDEKLVRNQDDELNFRLVKSGFKIFYTPKIRAFYRHRSSLKNLGQQYFQFGYFKPKIFQKHRRLPNWHCLAPGTLVLTLFLSGILGIFSFFWQSLFFAAADVYFLFLLITSLFLSPKYFLTLPIILAIIHLSYGFGFLKGVADLIIFRKG